MADIVIQQTENSITFKATSNTVSPTTLSSNGTTVRESMQNSKVFREAFRDTNENQETASLSRWREPKSTVKKAAAIIQSSEPSQSSDGVHAAPYGLISTVLKAYNRHYDLVLRPDDIWQAILTQFSFYVNAHAEQLRDCFVDFQGKKTLVIEMGGTLFSADFGTFAKRMVDEQIATNLKDEEVTEWLLPHFSTTTDNDRIAASVCIMSTLQHYFEYVCSLCCGIPRVTLEGTPHDWRLLRQKVDQLPKYDLDLEGGAKIPAKLMTRWRAMLIPVLDEFVASAEGHPRLAFWDKVCSHEGGGSGPSYLSGWITVFGCFTSDGLWRGGSFPDEQPRATKFTRNENGDWVEVEYRKEWPSLDIARLPVGAVSVPVLVDDNGVQYDTQMLAGQFAFENVVVGQSSLTIRPRTDWCIAYEGKPKANPRDYQHGEIRPS